MGSLKSKVDELDIGNFEALAVDLSNLRDAVKNDAVKNTEYDELVEKVNSIKTADTTDLVKKLIMTQKLLKLKRKHLIMIMVNILLLKNLISPRQIILQ